MRAQVIKFAFLSLVLVLLLSGCGININLPGLQDQIAKTNGILTNAINALGNQSADWQFILQDTVNKLTDSAQSTIRNEVSNTLQRAE